MSPGVMLRLACTAALVSASAALADPPGGDERGNWFGDPFVEVTHAITRCPTPTGPAIARSQIPAEEHDRAQRGTSCWLAGRCRLPNAYQYDAEIVPRVKKAILYDGRFADTSLWVEGRRRWIWLDGCVARAEQAAQLEQLVRAIDDVEGVVNRLVVTSP